MGLKAFTFETTMETGHRLQMYLVFRTMVVDNDQRTATLLFQGYPSQTERERQLEKGASKFFEFSMVLSGLDYLALFTMPISGPLGIAISELVWSLAANLAFIPDFETDENGNLVALKKSLTELDAKEIELPFEMPGEVEKAVAARSSELFAPPVKRKR